MKAAKQYFTVVVFIMLYKVVLAFESRGGAIQMKATRLLSSTFLLYCLLCYTS